MTSTPIHPAYKWAQLNTIWTAEECEMFACYTNGFRKDNGEFTQPMDFMSSWFKQSYLGSNW